MFEVVQGNDKLLDTLRLPDTDDMRSSRNRTFAFPASAAAASGQTRRDSKGESDRDIPSSALGCPSGALVSCFEFIDPDRFYGQVRPRVDVPLHTPRIGVRKTFDFGGIPRHHRASFVERDVSSNCCGMLVLEIMASPTPFRIRSIKGLRSASQSMGTIPLASTRFRTIIFLFRKSRSTRRARARASPSFAVAHPSSRSNGTKRTSAIPSLR